MVPFSSRTPVPRLAVRCWRTTAREPVVRAARRAGRTTSSDVGNVIGLALGSGAGSATSGASAGSGMGVSIGVMSVLGAAVRVGVCRPPTGYELTSSRCSSLEPKSITSSGSGQRRSDASVAAESPASAPSIPDTDTRRSVPTAGSSLVGSSGHVAFELEPAPVVGALRPGSVKPSWNVSPVMAEPMRGRAAVRTGAGCDLDEGPEAESGCRTWAGAVRPAVWLDWLPARTCSSRGRTACRGSIPTGRGRRGRAARRSWWWSTFAAGGCWQRWMCVLAGRPGCCRPAGRRSSSARANRAAIAAARSLAPGVAREAGGCQESAE